MFHFNCGWGGTYNGWYKMSCLNPNKTYNSNKTAVINICPEYRLGDVNGDDVVDIADVTTTVNNVLQNKYNEKSDVNSAEKVDVADVLQLSITYSWEKEDITICELYGLMISGR